MMLEKFLEYLQFEKRYSPHTITSYKKDLEDFSHFFLRTESSDNLATADKKIIRNFIVELSENDISKRSINRKLSSLRSFYLFLLKIGEIKVSPTEGISSLKFYPEKQIPISKEEMQDLNERIFEQVHDVLEKCIMEVLYQTGMRKAELCGLIFENVDLYQNELKVIGKGNKERVIPISDELSELLKSYLEIRNPQTEFKSYFFVNKKGKKLNEKFVYVVVNKYLSLITTKEKKSPHILRHSFATHVLDNGAEISKVKKILGHSSLASTQVYTNANIEQLKKVFNQAHPRASKKEEL
ncbi:integrase/recombinase XerC [Chryseobacterium bernardetii]|uniref:Integrase/recombinase XerC n=4 Tax=Chryseobacterium group TaxID=2782232 RepID=A0A543ENX3_9FLAO|nr:integrase/recombinase XerC [Chryseobacterium vietnamense]MDR6439396.1 integrase/recombinase XerC [Chryseobacterium bernardetii]MDR6458975.1 integrase/recombinase XerC [Chryseobacterium vietnamense]MDR6489338.1 integrase/recombinase XerC [Chryseobacterium vietnamense]TQM23288.1 integrase/recombinase XerC [Chryseobacterium aquifrigidense]